MGTMRGLERAVELLRPLVQARAWDYAVVWKLSDDPSGSRIFEWLDCCCSGGYQWSDVKEEKGDIHISGLCVDSYFQHPLRTKACEALFQLPSSLHQHSAIYEEVVISNQPKWLNYAYCSFLAPSPDLTGTKVLIPIAGGIIELFVTKQVPEDREAIDIVIALCDSSFHRPLMAVDSYDHISNSQQPYHSTSSSSNPIKEDPPFDFYAYFTLQKRLEFLQKQQEFVDLNGENSNKKANTKSEYHHTRNIDIERNRRKRLSEGLLTLRSLVPKISKMDRASILGDAIDFIKELQTKVKDLQNEIKQMEEDDSINNKAEPKMSPEKQVKETKHAKVEVEVEVSQLGKRKLWVKVLREKKRGGFGRLMEAIESLDLRVLDANLTTLNDQVLNILIVEANKADIQLKKLRASLTNVLLGL